MSKHKPHPAQPIRAPTAPTEPVTPAPPPAPAEPSITVTSGVSTPVITGLRLVDGNTTLAQLPLNAPILIDLGKLGPRASTFTLIADATGQGVGFTLRTAGGAVRAGLFDRYRGVKPFSINGFNNTTKQPNPAAMGPAFLTQTGQYVLVLTPYSGNDSSGHGVGAGQPVTLNVNVVATSPDPGPTPEPKPDTTLPTERAPESEWRTFAKRLLLRRGVTYPAMVGRSINDADWVLEVESGSGPLPVIDASQCNGSPLSFGMSSRGFRCIGTPRLFGGSTSSGRDLVKVRGANHLFSFWMWGGNYCYNWQTSENTSDITIQGGGTLGDYGGYFVWMWCDRRAGVTHTRPRFIDIDTQHRSIRDHQFRLYGWIDGLMRDCKVSGIGSPYTSSACLRLHDGIGFSIEASAPGSCVIGPCPSVGHVGGLNKTEYVDTYEAHDVTFGAGVILRQHTYLMNGSYNTRFAGTADNPIRWELGDEQVCGFIRGTGTDGGSAWGKPRPTGSFEHVRTVNRSGSGHVMNGDASGFTFADVLATNPTKGWVNRPWDKASMLG